VVISQFENGCAVVGVMVVNVASAKRRMVEADVPLTVKHGKSNECALAVVVAVIARLKRRRMAAAEMRRLGVND